MTGRPRRKLLLASYHFPPSVEVAGKPTARLVRYLERFGWETTVVAPPVSAYAKLDLVGYADLLREARVERTRMLPHVTDLQRGAGRLLARVRGREPAAGPPPPSAGAAPGRGSSAVASVRRMWRDLVSFPDRYTGWIAPAIARMESLVRRERFDALLSVAPAISSHLATLAVAETHRDLPWIAQFHDPWTLGTELDVTPGVRRTIAKALERRIVQRASRVLRATEEATELYRSAYPHISPDAFGTLHNGFDPTDFPAAGARDGGRDPRFTFVYTGTLYLTRDPTPLFDALAALIRAGRVRAADVRVRLMGDCAVVRGRRVSELAAERGLASVVEVKSEVPYPEALDALQRADVLLLFAEQQPAQIPAKLFEYLHVGRTILGFCDGASARVVEDTNSGVVVSSQDQATLQPLIERWINQAARGEFAYAGRRERIQAYRADALAEKLAADLDSLVTAR